STPYQPYSWDADLTVLDGRKQDLKNADSYFASTQRGIQMARAAGKPFCLNINISDPHKPFYATGRMGQVVADPNIPSRIFSPSEVPVPGFLFDHPDVRTELAQYYSSVRRADDCVAAVLNALKESGQVDNTVLFFLSDHGMPLPFAKTALWHHSTRTPWIVRWPGVTQPGSIDDRHMISAVDLLPTLLEIASIPTPDGVDGRSFAPTLRGESQSERDYVFKVYNENSGGNRSPMRSIQSKRFGYLFNPWSDGKRVFKTATTGTMTFRAMKMVAETDPAIAKRLELFRHGVVEEFYDYQNDPDALVNLINDLAKPFDFVGVLRIIDQVHQSIGIILVV
ncbi:MAG: sulfatase-like hydrolase/transferase, partial [Planctomycetota bacterium]